MVDERRVIDVAFRDKLNHHMGEQTQHMEQTNSRLTKIEKTFTGINIKKLDATVGQHSTTLNKIKGAGGLLVGGWVVIKAYFYAMAHKLGIG